MRAGAGVVCGDHDRDQGGGEGLVDVATRRGSALGLHLAPRRQPLACGRMDLATEHVSKLLV